MIDWTSKFDHIYCLHCLDYADRKPELDVELERVGILNSGIFEYYYSTKSPLLDYMRKAMREAGCASFVTEIDAHFYCTYEHYRILKDALLRGFERVLIIEDDVRFLKDLTKLQTLIESTPDVDYVNYFTHTIDPSRYLSYSRHGSWYFPGPTDAALGAVCYALSHKAIEQFVANQESYFCNSDLINREGLTSALAITPACIVELFRNATSLSQNTLYAELQNIGLDISDYNIMHVLNTETVYI